MIFVKEGKNLIVSDIKCLDLSLTLDCGEAFRWEEQEDGSWSGVAFGKFLNCKQIDSTTIMFHDTTEEEFMETWYNYFDFDRDYENICKTLKKDPLISKTIDDYYGIRILNQDSFEALISFVISQQNNIKRIKTIIKRICETYGDEVKPGWFSFPSVDVLSKLTVEDFEKLGTGYRAKYLKKLVDDIKCGDINLDYVKTLPLDEARKYLLDIYGVGIKVANCALLFGFQFVECFPIDTWMKKVMTYYPNGLPECFKGYEGIAQQYLFHWARNNL